MLGESFLWYRGNTSTGVGETAFIRAKGTSAGTESTYPLL